MANPCRIPKNVGVSVKNILNNSWLKFKKVKAIIIVHSDKKTGSLGVK